MYSGEIAVAKMSTMICGDRTYLEMGQGIIGDLYLYETDITFNASRNRLLNNVNTINRVRNTTNYNLQGLLKENYIRVHFKTMSHAEAIMHKNIIGKKYATMRLYLDDGNILYFTISNGKIDVTEQWVQKINALIAQAKSK